MNTKQNIVFLTIFFYSLFLYATDCPKPIVPPPPPPSNDECINAIPLNIQTSCSYTTYNNTGATATTGVPAPGCGGSTYNDVWFSIIVPANGSICVNTQAGTLTDCSMALYSGTCGALSLLNCNDNPSLGVNMPKISTFGFTPGSTIYVRFWDYNGNNFGTFGICVTSPTPPSGCGTNAVASDYCGLATPICNFNGYCGNTSSNYSADQPGNLFSVFCGSIENNSWLKFIADTSKVVLSFNASNCTTGSGIQMGIYETSNCTNFISKSTCFSNPGTLSGSITATNLTVGQTYYLMIDGFSGDICDYTITALSGIQTSGTISASRDTICLGQTSQLTASGGTIYQWSPTTGLSDPNIANPIASPTTTTTYTVAISGGISACPMNSPQITITVKNITPATATNNGPLCQGQTLNLSSTPSSSLSYSWSGPSYTSTQQNPSRTNVTTTMSGTYIVTVTEFFGCTATAQTTVTVNPLPIAPTISAPAVCSGQNAVFTISGTVGDTISYTGATGGIPTSPVVIGPGGSVVVTISNVSSNNTLTISSVSNGTCKLTPASLSATVAISPNIIPAFTLTSSYCLGATSELLPINSDNSIIGSWNPSTIRTDSSATYTYTFTPNAGQCAVPTTKTITINPIIDPLFTALGPYCVGGTHGTLPTTSTNGVNGTWDPTTISTTTAGTTAYIFTPGANQCAIKDTMNVTVNANTIPTFTALGPYCVGATPGVLPTTSTNGIVGTWSPSTVSTVSAGNITYTFTPTPSAGVCATTATMTIAVTANTTPTFSQLGPYCVGATPGTLPTSSNNVIAGTWNPSTISTLTAGSTTYTFTPTAGLCASSTTMNIIINSGPTPTITGDLTLCSSESTTLTVSGGSSYSWSTTQTGPSIYVSPTTTTTYTVTATNTLGCTQTTNATVVINGNPVISSIDSTIETCTAGNGSIQLTVTSGAQPYTYLWSNNVGNVSTISNLSSGTYLVTVTDNASCSTTKSIFLSNSPTPILSVIKIDDHCTQGVGEITINAVGGTGNYTYSWNTQPVQTTPSINHLVFGTYKVIVSDDYCSDSTVVNIGDNPAPTAAFDITPQISSILNPEIRFHNLSIGGTSFGWSFGDGEFSNEENPFHVYHNSQNYLVYLVVNDDFGCSDTAFNTVIIYENLEIFIPNAFTPNGDGLNDVFRPYGKGYSLDGFEMLIFDRWGKMIFETSDIEKGWNGKIDGVLANVNDVLMYKIVIKDLNYLDHKYIGTFTILGSKNALGN